MTPGLNTSLKPAHEPIVLARKPLVGTVARNVLEYGTGALNIGACRVASTDGQLAAKYASVRNAPPRENAIYGSDARPRSEGALAPDPAGRWPANVLLSHSMACASGAEPWCAPGCPVAELDAQSGTLTPHSPGTQCGNRDQTGKCRGHKNAGRSTSGETFHGPEVVADKDHGGASRFYPNFRYQARVGYANAADQRQAEVPQPVYGVADGVTGFGSGEGRNGDRFDASKGRWPTNVLLGHGEACDELDDCAPGCPVAELDAQSGISTTGKPSASVAYGAAVQNGENAVLGRGLHSSTPNVAPYGDSGGASRFYPNFRYQAKAPSKERPKVDGVAWPTVKPLALMSWLVRLVTPPGGVVLDPFAGTATTIQAARDEGFAAIGIERDPTALPLICRRLGLELDQVELFDTTDDEEMSVAMQATSNEPADRLTELCEAYAGETGDACREIIALEEEVAAVRAENRRMLDELGAVRTEQAHPDCWVKVLVRWRLVRPGDVIVNRDGTLSVVTHARAPHPTWYLTTVSGSTQRDVGTADPDHPVPILMSHTEREALGLLRADLGAVVMERPTTKDS